MTPQDHANVVAELLSAEQNCRQIGLLTKRFPDMGMDDAYAI